MTREEAIKICSREKERIQQALDVCADGDNYVSPDGMITALDYVEAMDMAIAALREQAKLARNLHDVASCEQVTEPLQRNGSGDSLQTTATKNQVTSDSGSCKNCNNHSHNEPLTLDDLRQMDGEPVYVVSHTDREESQWCIIFISDSPDYSAAYIAGCEYSWFDFRTYGKEWTAYRRRLDEPPKPPQSDFESCKQRG